MPVERRESTDWNARARDHWNNHPCGAVDEVNEDLSYFLAVEKYRYQDYAPWMKDAFEFERWRGKQVLEIGFGQGTDLVQYALNGAKCSGVDLAERHLQLARRNFELRGLNARLFLQDAESLAFDTGCFDRVHSFGVLHHMPNPERCVAEAYRVLKVGGEFLIGLYNRWSVFHLLQVLLQHGVLNGKLFQLGYERLLSTIEARANQATSGPLVRLYSESQLGRMLSDFTRFEIRIHHLAREDLGPIRPLIPRSLIPRLQSHLGWYLVGTAIKIASDSPVRLA